MSSSSEATTTSPRALMAPTATVASMGSDVRRCAGRPSRSGSDFVERLDPASLQEPRQLRLWDRRAPRLAEHTGGHRRPKASSQRPTVQRPDQPIVPLRRDQRPGVVGDATHRSTGPSSGDRDAFSSESAAASSSAVSSPWSASHSWTASSGPRSTARSQPRLSQADTLARHWAATARPGASNKPRAIQFDAPATARITKSASLVDHAPALGREIERRPATVGEGRPSMQAPASAWRRRIRSVHPLTSAMKWAWYIVPSPSGPATFVRTFRIAGSTFSSRPSFC